MIESIWLVLSLVPCYVSKYLIYYTLIILFLSLLTNYPIFNPLIANVFLSKFSDTLSWTLTLLTIFVGVLMIKVYLEKFFVKKFKLMSICLLSMLLSLVMAFNSSNPLLFYVMFELSLIPIFWMILGWGAQPERLGAGLSLLMYTICASLPLLIWSVYLIHKFSNTFYLFNFEKIFMTLNFSLTLLLYLFLILAFLIKFPIFMFHLWLPKAHVEAPVGGSMVLAAILLKLGGYGLIRMLPFLKMQFILSNSIQNFSLMGGFWISLMCLRQKDMKILIAYSSISHMALVITAILMNSSSALTGALFLMLAHGIVSSGLFFAANTLYTRTLTRNLLLSKSVLNFLPLFIFFWFLLCISNMGGPPSLNLLSEIIIFLAFLNFNIFVLPFMLILTFLAVAYTLILYSSIQHDQVQESLIKLNNLNNYEFLLLFLHTAPLFFLNFILFSLKLY